MKYIDEEDCLNDPCHHPFCPEHEDVDLWINNRVIFVSDQGRSDYMSYKTYSGMVLHNA